MRGAHEPVEFRIRRPKRGRGGTGEGRIEKEEGGRGRENETAIDGRETYIDR